MKEYSLKKENEIRKFTTEKYKFKKLGWFIPNEQNYAIKRRLKVKNFIEFLLNDYDFATENDKKIAFQNKKYRKKYEKVKRFLNSKMIFK